MAQAAWEAVHEAVAVLSPPVVEAAPMEVEDIDMEDEGDEDQDMDGEQVVFLAAAFGSLHH